jgi:hypothetical protein
VVGRAPDYAREFWMRNSAGVLRTRTLRRSRTVLRAVRRRLGHGGPASARSLRARSSKPLRGTSSAQRVNPNQEVCCWGAVAAVTLKWSMLPRRSPRIANGVVEHPDELITRQDERLRIVSDDLWNTVHIVQSARTPRGEAIIEAKRRKGRGPALWLSSLLVCSECGSNYVQYGRTDYICSGFHNGSTCLNGMRFRIAEIEKAVLEKLELDCLSPEALNRAADLAMDYLNKQQNPQPPPAPPETAAALADIDARESDIRDQFKAGKLPPSVFKTWLAEFVREREALTRRTTTPQKSARITRADFLQEYKSAVTRKLKIFTARENIAQSREALRTVLAEG